MASRPMPFEAAMMGMLVGLQRQISDLERRLLEVGKEIKRDGTGTS
jgi:hypothetical protein